MKFRLPRTRKAVCGAKPKENQLPVGLRKVYRRLAKVNTALLTNHYWEQRSYIATINMQYALKAVPLLPGEKIRVHFLHLGADLWQLWGSLYHACLADTRLEVKVIFLDAGQSPLAKKFSLDASFLQKKGIAYTPYADYDPYADRPHLLFYQSQLDEVYLHFAKCKANFLKKSGIRPVSFCGPEYNFPEPAAHKTLYQQYAQMFAWRIVAPRQEIKEDFYRHCLPGGDAVLVVENMDGETIRDGLLKALWDEKAHLAGGGKADLPGTLEWLAQNMPEGR